MVLISSVRAKYANINVLNNVNAVAKTDEFNAVMTISAIRLHSVANTVLSIILGLDILSKIFLIMLNIINHPFFQLLAGDV